MNRSENMRDITSKDISIEIKLGKALLHNGFRYRKIPRTFWKSRHMLQKSINFFDSEFRHGKYLLEN